VQSSRTDIAEPFIDTRDTEVFGKFFSRVVARCNRRCMDAGSAESPAKTGNAIIDREEHAWSSGSAIRRIREARVKTAFSQRVSSQWYRRRNFMNNFTHRVNVRNSRRIGIAFIKLPFVF